MSAHQLLNLSVATLFHYTRPIGLRSPSELILRKLVITG
jgi:hypothetical protein